MKEAEFIWKLKSQQDYIMEEAKEDMIDDDKILFISSIITKNSPEEKELLQDITNSIVSYGGEEEEGIVIPYHRAPKTKVVLGSLVALAAAGMLLVTVNTSTFATIIDGMRVFLNQERTVAVLTPTQYGSYDYTSYDDIPLQWRKFIWQFKHDRFALHSVSIYYSQNNTNISSYYTYQDDYLLIMLNLSNAPEATISDRTPDAEFVKQITVDDVIININKFVDTESNDPEDIEYSATFYIDNMEYSVSGNISEYEVEGIATEYVKFAKE